jgi:hypothetical protein
MIPRTGTAGNIFFCVWRGGEAEGIIVQRKGDWGSRHNLNHHHLLAMNAARAAWRLKMG